MDVVKKIVTSDAMICDIPPDPIKIGELPSSCPWTHRQGFWYVEHEHGGLILFLQGRDSNWNGIHVRVLQPYYPQPHY